MLLRVAPARYAVLEAVLLAVVVRELVPFLDVLDSHHEHAALADLGLAVRLAGMVDIACLVNLRLPVYGALLRYLEEILALARSGFLFGEFAADVLDDAGAFLDRRARKESESRA